PFLGRSTELDDVVELLRRGPGLLTLTGPGGTGKTRLALEAASAAADAFPDGLWWVPLAPLHDPELLSSALAQALHVPETGGPLVEALIDRVAGKRMLILLDNLEQLLPGAALIVARLRLAAGPTLLVTSRERLRLQGEQAYDVPSLTGGDAVELF